jgi:hypothetical protein
MSRGTTGSEIGGFVGCLVWVIIIGACWISALLRIALWKVIICVFVLVTSLSIVATIVVKFSVAKKRQRSERQEREHQEWLQSPEGRAHQEALQEAINKRLAEEDHQRKEEQELAARRKWNLYYESKSLGDVASMNGTEFEQFLARLFSRMGYQQISATPTNDQGGDLTCVSPAGVRVVVQAKRYKGTVGNDAVQQVHAAIGWYKCTQGMVVTNSTFTPAARELARVLNVALCDRQWLEEQIQRYLPPRIPDFSWEAFNQIVKDWQPGRTRSRKSTRRDGRWKRRRY